MTHSSSHSDIVPRRPLDAYRLDAETVKGEPESRDLDRWLALAVLFEDLVSNASVDIDGGYRAGLRRTIAGHLSASGFDGPSIITWEETEAVPISLQLVRHVAEEAERGGALQMAYSMLASADGLPHAEHPIEYGRVLALRARVARKANAFEVASDLYHRIATLARRSGSQELRARSAIGFGVIAQSKGNYPEAKRQYLSATRAAARANHAPLAGVAHHGLMVVAAKRGDFGEALTAGWKAFRNAQGDMHRETEMLLNLAQLAFDLGEPTAALHGFSAALKRHPAMPQRLPALGGAARAAAALAKRDLVKAYAMEIDNIASGIDAFSHPHAVSQWDLARAFQALGETARAHERAALANAIAVKHGLHELSIESEAMLDDARPHRSVPPTPASSRPHQDFGGSGRAVLTHMVELEEADFEPSSVR